MVITRTFLLIFVLLSSTIVFAKEEPKTNLSKTEIEKILVDKFVDVAAAYYINKQCNFLSKEENAEYVGQIANLNLYANKLIGKDVFAAQNKGKAIAMDPRLKKCGVEAQQAFKLNRTFTKMMYEDLILH